MLQVSSLAEGIAATPKVARLPKLPRLDFVPSPNQYRTATNGNGHKTRPTKTALRVDLSPRLELLLSLDCATDDLVDPEFEG